MALTDWTVEIFDVVPRKNSAPNPYTNQPIDPDGLTLSLFTMKLTHVPSGKVLERADLASVITPEFLQQYARNVITVAEQNMAVQKTDTAPSALKGVLDVTIPAPVDPRTQAEKDLSAFQQLDAQVAQTTALYEKLKAIEPKDAAALDAKLADLTAARDAAAKVVSGQEATSADAIAVP